MLVGWLQKKILRPTVKIFLVVITKGTKCCLNCLIIRQTNICPSVLSPPIKSRCSKNLRCSAMKTNMSTIDIFKKKVSIMQQQAIEISVTHLLMAVIIYMGCGLYSDLIYAWKSGKKPSARRETIRSTIPQNQVFCYDYLRFGSATLNITIPSVTNTPTTIFFSPNFNFLSLTLEQSTPTKITERILQDLNIITTGKLVRQMAYVQVRVEIATVRPHMAEFLLGMLTWSQGLIVKWLTNAPIIHVIPHGNIRNPEAQLNVYYFCVKSLTYLYLSLNS